MKLAILFWFHRDPEVCANRLALLRKFNPDAAIYGLYGGDTGQEAEFRAALQGDLDDFYSFLGDQPTYWKWWNGDLMLAEWYRARGKDLPWDTVAVIQGDMLVFGEIGALFPDLKKGEILLSGLRPVREVERWWFHVSTANRAERAQYQAFLDHIRSAYAYDDDPLACLFIVACLPRQFLERYSDLKKPELGFLEYKIPIYAQIFGTPFCRSHALHVWWNRPIFPWYPHRWWNPTCPPVLVSSPAERALNANKREVSLGEIRRQLRAPDGARIFHPVTGMVELDDVL